MRQACDEAGVALVTGDTKVVDRGKGDRVFITTRASAWCPKGDRCRSAPPGPATASFVSGTLGDHGIAIMSVREGIEFETVLESDSASLVGLDSTHAGSLPNIRCMRDPTRGGLSSALNELAPASRRRRRPERGGHPGAARSARRLRDAGARSAVRRQRGKADRGRPAGRCRSTLGCDAAASAGKQTPPLSAKSLTNTAGMVLMKSLVGGSSAVVTDCIAGENNCQDLLTRRPQRRRTNHGREQRRLTGAKRQREPAVKEVHVLWITARPGL